MSENGVVRDGVAVLRRRIAEIEGRFLPSGSAAAAAVSPGAAEAPSLVPRRSGTVLPFGVGRLDAMLRGGLRRHALHELRGEASRNGAATGFATALLALVARHDDRPLLWIVERTAGREAGLPYGAGLDRFGLDSRRLILVEAGRTDEALWVFEEALRCRGLAAALAEIRGHPRLLDLTASRRLALRARDSGVTGLLLRQVAHPDPGAALTRWLVTPRPAGTLDDYAAGIGRPAWNLVLERNRLGRTGQLHLEWDHDRRAFAEPVADASLPAHPRPVAAAARHRPAAPPSPGEVVALGAAS